MAGDGSLIIPFSPGTRIPDTALEKQIEQIILERGVFRKINVNDLKQEIQHANASSHDVVPNREDDDDESDDESPQAQQDNLWRSRDEMVQKLSYAQNEILSALDFVSLLLSNHNAAAQASMSPALKELVPPKTLDCRTVEYQAPSVNVQSKLNDVSEGWKAESFHSASERLKSASLRLEQETQTQGKYWDQIAMLKAQGWSVSRLPTDSRAIGVHFGFQEAAVQFRAKGFALLQQKGLGDLELDSRLRDHINRAFTVDIYRNGVKTGKHRISPHAQTLSSARIVRDLTSTRDALFLEELFYEINREARHISNQGVSLQQHHVHATIFQSHHIRISWTEDSTEEPDREPRKDDALARMITISLQLLLISEHERLYRKRSERPPPMTPSPPTISEYAILRPILAQLRHEAQVHDVAQMCQSYVAYLRAAGIELVMAKDPVLRDPGSPSSGDTVESLKQRVITHISLNFHGQAPFIITIETYLAAPSYGTTFRTGAINFKSVSLGSETIDDVLSLGISIASFVTVALVFYTHNVLESKPQPQDKAATWSISRPHSGEIQAMRDIRVVAKVVTTASADGVFMRYIVPGSQTDQGPQESSFKWTESGLEYDHSPVTATSKLETIDDVVTQLTATLGSKG